MNNVTVTKIDQVETSLVDLKQFGIKIDLSSILVEEFVPGLASDISIGI